ncbi:MAG: anchored repeat ABC transporter, substrate-binding protein [Rothia sp. (in: high G+C Gram-positive bacteria)]|uniref:anchored repeat ABC transporter, substrate-binding protein n=1 Tax=Rothia sp. (in: high G+C Gram-positive bacteria) TaxID=1885016 RepID=UPI0026DF4A74|nr:anchored repeat ABC transporter, substrate-binding protein [Rothia sp. (in: high G+C Gram-positive bacteria)]MDO5750449.1 anchored repeat ABC transporter, substrate-binding protein [Rothia sp. (in: high G+C Gram-positive bacteria)]
MGSSRRLALNTWSAPTRRQALRWAAGAGLCSLTPALSSCAPVSGADRGLSVVASTPIIADWVRQVVGDSAQVISLVPSGADPHSYEPSLRDIRSVVYSSAAFTNGMLLEQRKLLSMMSNNLPQGAPLIPLAERVESFGGRLLPMVEDASLDSLWLGLRVEGGSEGMLFGFSSVRGPSQLTAFITQTFGAVELLGDSHARGVNVSSTGEEQLRTQPEQPEHSLDLPAAAHTHLSWSFGAAGVYELRLWARGEGRNLSTVLYWAVGIPASRAVQIIASRRSVPTERFRVLSAGHADLTAIPGENRIALRVDAPDDSHSSVPSVGNSTVQWWDPEFTVCEVPSRTLQDIPAGASYRFLRPSAQDSRGQVYLLAQAVLGKHVHGEIDPHFWHSVPNARAAIACIAQHMGQVDPPRASLYAQRAVQADERYRALDEYLHTGFDRLPDSGRQLVTTHDGYRYLAQNYGLKIAGFVTAVSGAEPSVAARQRLQKTIQDLSLPAIYIEKNIRQRSPVLGQIAADIGVPLIPLYSDSLDESAPSYEQMMRANMHAILAASNIHLD